MEIYNQQQDTQTKESKCNNTAVLHNSDAARVQCGIMTILVVLIRVYRENKHLLLGVLCPCKEALFCYGVLLVDYEDRMLHTRLLLVGLKGTSELSFSAKVCFWDDDLSCFLWGLNCCEKSIFWTFPTWNTMHIWAFHCAKFSTFKLFQDLRLGHKCRALSFPMWIYFHYYFLVYQCAHDYYIIIQSVFFNQGCHISLILLSCELPVLHFSFTGMLPDVTTMHCTN